MYIHWPWLRSFVLSAVALLIVSECRGQAITGDAKFDVYTYDNGSDGSLISPGQAFFDRHGGELIVASPGNHRVIIYDPDLTPKFSFQHYVVDRQRREMTLGEPKMAVANSEGNLLIVDNLADYLDILDFRGKPISRIYPNRLLGDSTLKVKSDLVAIDNQDNVYLSVTGDVQVVIVLDKFLELKRQILRKGADKDLPYLPLGMTVFDSLLIISDLQGTPAIRVYDTLGQYLTGFGGRDIGRSDFSLPVALVATTDSAGGTLFLVADALRQVVKLLDQKGELISNIGGYGIGLGAFAYPSGIATDGNRTFYVVERVGARIQRFVLH